MKEGTIGLIIMSILLGVSLLLSIFPYIWWFWVIIGILISLSFLVIYYMLEYVSISNDIIDSLMIPLLIALIGELVLIVIALYFSTEFLAPYSYTLYIAHLILNSIAFVSSLISALVLILDYFNIRIIFKI
jgi:hypothetical protein